MTARDHIKLFVFKTLRAMDEVPISDEQLTATLQVLIAPKPTLADISAATRDLEGDGYITGTRDEVFKQITWTLTEKGKHKAAQL
jgi:hypothetical protein